MRRERSTARRAVEGLRFGLMLSVSVPAAVVALAAYVVATGWAALLYDWPEGGE